MKSVTFPNGPIKMAGNLHLPKDFSKDRSYVAIVCVHPAGGVKEQTAGRYASKLADEGMVALAYDASYQGESGGESRQEEDPYARVEDIRAAVDYLTTLGFVDQERICVLGICSGGGYAINAAMTDRRIKAVGTVSAINLGAMYRAGYEGTVADMSQAFTLLETAAKGSNGRGQGGPDGDACHSHRRSAKRGRQPITVRPGSITTLRARSTPTPRAWCRCTASLALSLPTPFILRNSF